MTEVVAKRAYEDEEELVRQDEVPKREKIVGMELLLELLREEEHQDGDAITRAAFDYFQTIGDDDWRHKEGIFRETVERAYENSIKPRIGEHEDLFPQFMRGLSRIVFLSTLRCERSTRSQIEREVRVYIDACLDDLDREDEEANWLFVSDFGGDVDVKEMDAHWNEFIAPFLRDDEVASLKKRLAWAMCLYQAESKEDTIRESFHVDTYRDFCYVFDELGLELDDMTKEEIQLYFEQNIYPLCWSSEIKSKVKGFCDEAIKSK